MANIKSAEKRNRQNIERRERNRALRSRMRSAVRRLRQSVEEGDRDKARELLPDTLSLIDATAQKSAVHRNAAARTKSRLARSVAGLDGAD